MFKNPIALKNLLNDRDSYLASINTPIHYLNYIVAAKTQDNFNTHLYTNPLNDNNTHYLMDRKFMASRTGTNLTEQQYMILLQYISTSHKKTFEDGQ